MKTILINKTLNISNKIKYILFRVGINEKYISFDYLADFLENITQKEFSYALYNETISLIATKYNISIRTTKQGISKVINQCNFPEIKESLCFNLSSHSLYNRINALKCYIENLLTLNNLESINETQAS